MKNTHLTPPVANYRLVIAMVVNCNWLPFQQWLTTVLMPTVVNYRCRCMSGK